MTRRPLAALLAAVAVLVTGATVAQCPPPAPGEPGFIEELVHVPGHAEPHTPGSGAPEELPVPAPVEALLGPAPDLNQVSYLRVAVRKPSGAPPRAVLILIPGFLGGAGSFLPLARNLARDWNGNLEVWAVDRRPNQLEDRLGGRFAAEGAASASGDAEAIRAAVYAGAQFYFADLDQDPTGDFPGTRDLDIDLDGVLDAQLPLEDEFGVSRSFARMSQDDLRYAAYWGVDTYVRDWKVLVDRARDLVGPDGLVLFGGHSMGTTWAGVFAAYDFDPDPGVVDAGHDHIDGVLLLEGGGPGSGSGAAAVTRDAYLAQRTALATPGGPEIFLAEFQGVAIADLGPSAEIAGVAGFHLPDEAAVVQRTPLFGASLFSLFFQAPSTNETVVGLFIDDDHQPVTAFRGSFGFTDDGPNRLFPPSFGDNFYVADPIAGGGLRTWKHFDDPGLPTCPPAAKDPAADGGRGCAILDNGAKPLPTETNRIWGREVEVSGLRDFLELQFGAVNFAEWYFLSGPTNLDLQFGRNSGPLVAQFVAAEGDEGPLVVTQNAGMDRPILCIGGSNGLAPTERSFAGYLGSIATPPADQRVVILEGYAHLDVTTARDNAVVPAFTDWANELLQRKLLGTL
jgi:hypothetical protein